MRLVSFPFNLYLIPYFGLDIIPAKEDKILISISFDIFIVRCSSLIIFFFFLCLCLILFEMVRYYVNGPMVAHTALLKYSL